MKKTILFLLCFFIVSFIVADVTFVTVDWSATVGGCTSSPSFGAYNWTTGHFLVCDYNAAAVDKVRIASGTDGSLTGAKLNTTGLNLGSLGVFAICVTKDGVIYGATDIKSDGVTAGRSLIRWANEGAVPTQQDPAEPLGVAMEFSRAMDAIGTGANTVIGVTGTVVVLEDKVTFLTTTDGLTYSVTDNTPVSSLASERIKQGVALVPGMAKVYGTKADGSGQVCRLDTTGVQLWAASPGFTPPNSYTAPPAGFGAAAPIGYAQGHNAVFVIGFLQTNEYLSVLNGDTGAIITQVQIGQDIGTSGYGTVELDEEAGVGYFIARSVTANSYVCGKISFDPYVIPTNANVWNIYE